MHSVFVGGTVLQDMRPSARILNGRPPDTVLLFARWGFFERKKHNIGSINARDGAGSGRMTLFARWGLFERKEK